MLALSEQVSSYIEYLRSHSLSVSIHFAPEVISRLPYEVWKNLLPYNSHNNPYCLAVKSCRAEDCISHQRAIIGSLDSSARRLCCHAGVSEYIFPISLSESNVGYVAVSGHVGDSDMAPDQARAWLSSLVDSEISPDPANALIPPLVLMLSTLVGASAKLEESERNLISQYLAENHTGITFDNFCRHFLRSKSYMSHKFSKMFGMSFSSYCNFLKLEDARRLLLLTDESITDIALNCGFGDVAYFIRLFKAEHGISPLKYRLRSRRDTEPLKK